MTIRYQCLLGSILSLLVIISFNPIYVWGYYKLSLSFITIISFFFFITYLIKYNIIILSLTRFSLIILVFTYNYLLGMSISGVVIYTAPIIILLMSPNNMLEQYTLMLKKIYCLLIMPSIILWFIHHISQDFSLFYLGQVPDHLNPSIIKASMNENYSIFPFTVTLEYMHRLNGFYRLIGFFDEPGMTGTFVFFLLASSDYKLNTKTDKIIFISGLLSLSLAFYALSILFLFLQKVRTAKGIMLIMGGIGMLIILTYSSTIFHESISSRFIIKHNNNGDIIGFQGNNREGSTLNNDFIKWTESESIVLLLGSREYQSLDGSSSWKMFIIKTGIIGLFIFLLIIYLMLIIFTGKYRPSWSQLIFIMCFIASFYQRPDMIKFFYLLMLTHYFLQDKYNKSRIS